MEESTTSLDEMINLYEQGMVLVKQCEDRLAEAEVKITELGRES